MKKAWTKLQGEHGLIAQMIRKIEQNQAMMDVLTVLL